MRQILMSKPGEFPLISKTDYLRGAAIKMLAGIIKKSTDPQAAEAAEKEVVIFNKAPQHKLGTRR